MRIPSTMVFAACLPCLVACGAEEPTPAPVPDSPVPAASANAGATAAEERRPFCRYVERDDGGHLQVLVATYRHEATTVTLHASVHLADPEHYAELQRRFDGFDILLYELVGDSDLRPHPSMEPGEEDWYSTLMSGMGRGFTLDQQLDCLDYRRPHFVHADMTAEEFDEAMEEAGTSIVGELFAGAMPDPDHEADANARQADVVKAFREGRGAQEMRILGARILTEPTRPPRQPTVIIEGRNDRCLAVLQEQIDEGVEDVGIYYGAAHMEHMEQRLLTDFGFERVAEEWLVAWDCTAARFPRVEKGLKRKRYRARQDLKDLSAAVTDWSVAHPGVDPTWDGLRASLPGEKLPGRADGTDPWGRRYVLRVVGGTHEVRCLGSDGVIDTGDDVSLGR